MRNTDFQFQSVRVADILSAVAYPAKSNYASRAGSSPCSDIRSAGNSPDGKSEVVIFLSPAKVLSLGRDFAPARLLELNGGIVDLASVYFFVLSARGNRAGRQSQSPQNSFPFHALNIRDGFEDRIQRADPQAISNSRACVISRLPTGRT